MKLTYIKKIEKKLCSQKPFKNQQNKHLLILFFLFLYHRKKILFLNAPSALETEFKTVNSISMIKLKTLNEKDIMLTLSYYDMIVLFYDELETRKISRVEADAQLVQRPLFQIDLNKNDTTYMISSLLALSKRSVK